MDSLSESRPRRAFFVINSLEGGGAERVFATLLNTLPKLLPCAVELVLLDTFEEKYATPPGLPRHLLNSGMSLPRSIARLVSLVRREKPDLLFSFLTRANCAAIIAGKMAGVPVVVSERVHTTSHFGAGLSATINRLVVRLLYPRAVRIVAVSQGVAADLERNFHVRNSRLTVIYNPVDREGIAAKSILEPPIALPETFYLAIGRLVPNKSFEMLLRAFALADIAGELVILGEGPERAKLLATIKELGLTGRIHLPGHVDNPFALMARAKAYVSASTAEGFPNALVEALTLGKAVAVTDCDSGPAEILGGALESKVTKLTEARHGLLVPMGSIKEMAAAFRVLSDPAQNQRLAILASRRAQDFDLESTVARYRSVLLAALAGSVE